MAVLAGPGWWKRHHNVAVTAGVAVLCVVVGFATGFWLLFRLSYVIALAILLAYHAWCWRLMCDFAAGRNARSARWYRWFNEVPSLLLIGIVLLAVVRPF